MTQVDLNYEDVEWYLVFCDTEVRYWWSIFLRRGFEHVYAIRRQGDCWLIVSPNTGYTDVDMVHDGVILNPNVTVVKVKCFRNRLRVRVPWLLYPFSCVEQVKALLGLRHWCLTPYQLYKAVMMDNMKGVIADGVAEGMKVAHMNTTPSEQEQEHPELQGMPAQKGLPLRSLLNLGEDHE